MKEQGTFNFSGNLEVKKDAPLDSRDRIPTYADLTKAETWTDADGGIWAYEGMNTVCRDRLGKIYQLTSSDFTNINNWKEIGGSGGGGSDQYIIEVPMAVLQLSDSSTSEDILAAFGGAQAYINYVKQVVENGGIGFGRFVDSGNAINVIIQLNAVIDTDRKEYSLSVYLYMMNIVGSIIYQYESDELQGSARYSSLPIYAYIEEAPKNSKTYGRNNGQWTEITGGGSDTQEVFLFSPTLDTASRKVTQQDYDNLQAAVQANKIVMVPNGLYQYTVDGSYVPASVQSSDPSSIVLFYTVELNPTNHIMVSITISSNLTVTVVQNEINNGKLKVESGSEAIDLLTSNKRITDQTIVKDYINKVLGTDLNTFVNDTLAGKNPNRFIYDNSSYSGVYMTFTGLYNSDDNIVSFIYSCTNSQSLKQLIMNDGSTTGEDYLFEVKDVVTSDNLNTITKISSTDYAALGTKDPNTMYAVTE